MLKKCTKKELIEIIGIYEKSHFKTKSFKTLIADYKVNKIGRALDKNIEKDSEITKKLKSETISKQEKQEIYFCFLENEREYTKLYKEYDLWEKELYGGEN